MSKPNETGESRSVTSILLSGLVIGIGISLLRIAFWSPSPSEALLLSALLTIFSILGSWIVSKYYSEHDFNKRLRLFALKASEKVTNLSKELDRLSAVLQEELKDDEYDSPNEAILAKTIRMEGAIHIIRTLRSVNDGSLSDWQGVIGEEITAKLESQEQREESLRELFERFESLQLKQPLQESTNDTEPLGSLRSEVDSIRDDLRLLASQVSGMPVRSPRVKGGKLPIQRNCPVCSELLTYVQKPKPNSVKRLRCSHCSANLFSRQVNGEYILKLRVPHTEELECPVCSSKIRTDLDPVPGAVQDLQCESCKSSMRAIRREDRVKIKVRPGLSVPSAVVQGKVKESMGPQPWAPGRARAVAEELGLPLPMVSMAIKSLVAQGIFKLQVDGKLYAPADNQPENA